MWYDAEMQVQWLWDGGTNRYYDPELERYLQPDAPGGSYVFAKDDPLGTGVTAARSGGLQPHIGCFIITTVYFTSAVCPSQRDPIYMFLIGDDEATLGSDAGFCERYAKSRHLLR